VWSFFFFFFVYCFFFVFFFFQAEDGIRDGHVTGVQTCALPISNHYHANPIALTAIRHLVGASRGTGVQTTRRPVVVTRTIEPDSVRFSTPMRSHFRSAATGSGRSTSASRNVWVISTAHRVRPWRI